MKQYAPFLTWRFEVALQFASGLHHQQARKGAAIPYIAHLMSVCALVLEAGGEVSGLKPKRATMTSRCQALCT